MPFWYHSLIKKGLSPTSKSLLLCRIMFWSWLWLYKVFNSHKYFRIFMRRTPVVRFGIFRHNCIYTAKLLSDVIGKLDGCKLQENLSHNTKPVCQQAGTKYRDLLFSYNRSICADSKFAWIQWNVKECNSVRRNCILPSSVIHANILSVFSFICIAIFV